MASKRTSEEGVRGNEPCTGGQRGQIDPQVLLILVSLALAWWVGMQAWRGIKWTGHEVGCGFKVAFTGQHCPPKDPDPLPPNPFLNAEVP